MIRLADRIYLLADGESVTGQELYELYLGQGQAWMHSPKLNYVKGGLIGADVRRLYAEVFDLRPKGDFANFVQIDGKGI